MYILGDTITKDFTTHDPLTGNVSDADSLPTVEVFEGDNDTPIVSPLVEKRSGKTGNYRCLVVASEGNGFELGKSYNVIATAIVSGVTAKSRIDSFILDSKRNANMQDLSSAEVSDEVLAVFLDLGYSSDRASKLDDITLIEDNTRSILFQDGIWIDTVNGVPGTAWPIGTQLMPVSNLTDALSIATLHNVRRFKIRGSITLTQDLPYYIFEGTSSVFYDSVFLNGKNLQGSKFSNLSASGATLGINLEFYSCDLSDVSNLAGRTENCTLKGTIGLGAPGTSLLGRGGIFWDCIIDMVGAGRVYGIVGIGTPTIINSAPGCMILGVLASGLLTIDSSCTGGMAMIEGGCNYVNNGTDMIIQDMNLMNNFTIANAIWSAADAEFLIDIIRNKKLLQKEGSTWYLICRNATDTEDILKKALKDKNGDEVSDIAAGILAQELKSSV